MERTSQEEQSGTNFSFVAPFSEELRAHKDFSFIARSVMP